MHNIYYVGRNILKTGEGKNDPKYKVILYYVILLYYHLLLCEYDIIWSVRRRNSRPYLRESKDILSIGPKKII